MIGFTRIQQSGHPLIRLLLPLVLALLAFVLLATPIRGHI